MRLMRALWASGDRAGAIQHGRAHAALMHEELEIEARRRGAAIDRRDRGRARKPAVAGPADCGVRTLTSRSPIPLPAPPDAGADAITGRRVRLAAPLPGSGGDPRGGGRRLVAAALSFGRPQAVAEGAIHLDAEPVVVAPFRVSGSDASLGYLREGMVELLSSRLDDDSAARAIDPGRVIGAWRKERLTGPADTRSPDAIRIARELGGGRVIVGGIVGNAARARRQRVTARGEHGRDAGPGDCRRPGRQHHDARRSARGEADCVERRRRRPLRRSLYAVACRAARLSRRTGGVSRRRLRAGDSRLRARARARLRLRAGGVASRARGRRYQRRRAARSCTRARVGQSRGPEPARRRPSHRVCGTALPGALDGIRAGGGVGAGACHRARSRGRLVRAWGAAVPRRAASPV